jgi:transposase
MTTTLKSQEDYRIENESLRERIISFKERVSVLEEQIEWFKKHLFGKRSERDISSHPDQLEFAGFESLKNEDTPTNTVQSHKRKKPSCKGQESIVLPKDLPVEKIVLDLTQKTCPKTGKPLVKIGEEVTNKLAFRPGSFFIKQYVRPKYAVPNREEEGVFIESLPDSIIPKCPVDESFLAHTVTQKYADHLPHYRVTDILTREGVFISRKLLSKWSVRSGLELLPIYEEMKKHIFASENLFIDETPINIQRIGKCQKGYMWTLVGGKGVDPPYRIYDFRENRCYDHVTDLLTGYQGNLHSDKYGAYLREASNDHINWCPCYSHIRRKFFDAQDMSLFRDEVLRHFKNLFMLERVAWSKSPEERLSIRQEKELPVIDKMIELVKEKLNDKKILPKSKLREAIGYFCGLIPYLKNYANCPWARLDNNIAERAIRPLAIGRKNWLFFGSAKAGQSAAVLFSLVQTCRGLGINPRDYLEDVMRKLMGHSCHKLYELLPDQWAYNLKHPCKS